MEKKFAAPLKEVFLTGIHMGSDPELIRRRYEFSIFLLDLTEQVVQLSGVLLLHQCLHKLSRLGKLPGEQISLG